MTGDRLPRNASVAGFGIRGLPTAQAVDTLESRYAPTAAAPIAVRGAGAEHQLVPDGSGLGVVDYPATVGRAGAGRSLSPAHIWRVLTGGGPIDPVPAIDAGHPSTAVDELAARFERPAKDAVVAYAGTETRRTEGKIVVVPAQDGLTLSRDSFAQAVLPTVPRRDQRTVQASLSEFKPGLTTEEADRTRPTEVHGEFTTQSRTWSTATPTSASPLRGSTATPLLRARSSRWTWPRPASPAVRSRSRCGSTLPPTGSSAPRTRASPTTRLPGARATRCGRCGGHPTRPTDQDRFRRRARSRPIPRAVRHANRPARPRRRRLARPR